MEFTKALEKEKRKLMIIEEQIKQANSEINEKKQAIDRIKNPEQKKPAQDKLDAIEISTKGKKIKNETIKLNITKTQNLNYRSQIDMLRKDMTSKKDQVKKLNKLTKKARKLAESQNHEAIHNIKLADEHVTQRIALRAKHEEDKNMFEGKIIEMQQKLHEQDEPLAFENKALEQQTEQAGGDKTTDYKNPIQILKLRLAKIVATNKEKKRLMDQYLRNVKVIEDAFDQIKEATGIQSIDEIVNSFIKAEEQIYALINYVNTLGTETDQLDD